MSALTRAMGALLRRLAVLLPAHRREWAEALAAEAAEVPPGAQRLAWLAGGLRLAAGQARLGRRVGWSLAFGAAAMGTAWSGWGGAPADPAVLVNRVDVIVIVVILAGLPLAVRRLFGPVRDSAPARIGRAVGYAAIFALVLVKAVVQRFAYVPPNTGAVTGVAWTGEILFLAAMAAYASGILAVTARRPPAAPATLSVGTAAGAAIGLVIYVLGPLGYPLRFAGAWPAGLYDAALALAVVAGLAVTVATGRTAVRRAARQAGPLAAADPARQGAMAGLCAGATAALLISVLSTGTIALLPHEAGLLQWAMAHLGATSIFGRGTQHAYEVNNSVYAAGYFLVLVLFPVLGSGIAAWGGFGAAGPPGRPRQGPGRGCPLAPGPAQLDADHRAA
jgi:hypothetical protein